ncbi:MAG: hypothetical protein Q9168_003949 [Polycauliona sp. 1 TL-2023]
MAKREYSSDFEPEDRGPSLPRKKRVPFTTAKPATQVIIKRNATTSPLLKLPTELRERIWREVLGGRVVHLDGRRVFKKDPNFRARRYVSGARRDLSKSEPETSTSGSGASEDSDTSEEELASPPHHDTWRHTICKHDYPEAQPDKKVVTHRHGVDHVLWLKPHSDCIVHEGDIWGSRNGMGVLVRPTNFPTMSLSVLRTSRQIFVEANQVLWTTNTFSFANGDVFGEFMKTRNIHQKRLIHTLRFEMSWGNDDGDWSTALSMRLVKSLIGLRTLRLSVICDLEKELWEHTKDDFVRLTTHAEGLRKLSILPLQTVEVAVRELHHADSSYGRALWQKKERNQCAEDLKALLLNPNGAEVYAASHATVARRRIEGSVATAGGTKWWIP